MVGSGDWPSVRLADVATIVMGQSPPGSTYNEDGIGLPFFQGVRDFNYRHPTPRVYCSEPSRVAQADDILLSVRAPIGRVNVADRECATGRGIAIIKPNTESDARYLEFALRSLERSWDSIEGSGSVFGNATKRDLESLVLPWPDSASERGRIAGVLGALDDKIELNRRMARTLEQIARALFRSWFVDFEPVRAKQAQRWRPGQSLPGLPAQLRQLFPDQLEPSPQGPIPQGWQVATLGEIATFVRESTDPQSSPDALFEHYSIPAFDDGKLPVRQPGSEIKSAKLRVPPDAVLVSRLNPEIERVWLPPAAPGDRAVCSTEFLVLTPTQPFTRHYVYCLARSQAFRGLIESLVTGTSKSHQRARADAVLSLGVLVPPRPLVESFEQQAADLLDRALHARDEIPSLAAQRDKLLAALLTVP